MDRLLDNAIALTIPLKHEVELNVHGFVSPASFVYGPSEEDAQTMTCMKEKINLTFHVISAGLSMAPNIGVELMIPNAFAPRNFNLFNILDVKTTAGECVYNNYTRNCTLPETGGNILKDVFMFFSRPHKRLLYCMKDDNFCTKVFCKFGNMESGTEATVHMHLEATPALLEMDEASTLKFEIKAKASLEKNPKVIELHKRKQVAHVILEGVHNQKTKYHVTMIIIGCSSVAGIILFSALSFLLWKMGFFKRPDKLVHEDQNGRESLSLVEGKEKEDHDDN
uniref:Integrin subunit alpha 4 n=2 Tax=Crocodylus porosus TaxID=8502 RepID=A0A7M4F3X2_CROPO